VCVCVRVLLLPVLFGVLVFVCVFASFWFPFVVCMSVWPLFFWFRSAGMGV